MKRTQVIILIVALVGLFGIGLFIRKDQQDTQIQSAQMLEDSRRLTQLTIESDDLKDKDTAMLTEMEEKKYAQTCIMFRFENLNRNLYDVIVPLMDEYGYAGNLTLTDGVIPSSDEITSSEDVITVNEFQKLCERGWDYSLEDSNVVKYPDEISDNLSDSWIANLDQGLLELNTAGIAVPSTFLCNMKDSDSKVNDVLRERGFQLISMNDGDCQSLNQKLTMADFSAKSERLYTGDSVVLGTIDAAIQEKYHVIVEVGQVIAGNKDENNVDLEKFIKFLEYLKELEASEEIQVMTFTEFSDYEQTVDEQLAELQKAYDEEKATIDKRLEEIEKESAEIKAKRMTQDSE